MAVQELSQAIQLRAGASAVASGISSRMMAAPALAARGGRRRVPPGEARSERAVDPAVGQRLEAIGVAARVGLVERGVERADVEPIDGARRRVGQTEVRRGQQRDQRRRAERRRGTRQHQIHGRRKRLGAEWQRVAPSNGTPPCARPRAPDTCRAAAGRRRRRCGPAAASVVALHRADPPNESRSSSSRSRLTKNGLGQTPVCARPGRRGGHQEAGASKCSRNSRSGRGVRPLRPRPLSRPQVEARAAGRAGARTSRSPSMASVATTSTASRSGSRVNRSKSASRGRCRRGSGPRRRR